jgi:hypothetical protein
MRRLAVLLLPLALCACDALTGRTITAPPPACQTVADTTDAQTGLGATVLWCPPR